MASLLEECLYFEENQARVYAAEIVVALETIHRLDIVFRDLKPENIIIDSEGHAVLIDFGLAAEFQPGFGLLTEFCGYLDFFLKN